MSEPVVSVIIPAHNSERFIAKALSSVLDQSFRDFEVTIVDDGSTDNTLDVLTAFTSDIRVSVVKQQNLGPSAARNVGMRASEAEFIAFLDADDRWQPGKLEVQLSVFEKNPHVGVVHSEFAVVDERGEPQRRRWQRPLPRGSLTADLMFGNVIAGSVSSVIVRRRCMETVGGFDEDIWIGEDQDAWRRLSMVCEFYFLDATHVLIREHSSSLQGDSAKTVEGKLLHLDRMKKDTPPDLRYLLPQVAYQTYWDTASLSIRSGDILEGTKLLAKIPTLGFKYLLKLTYDAGIVISRKVIKLAESVDQDGSH